MEFETESLINRMRLVGLVRGLLRGTVSEEAGCTGGLVIEEKLQVFIEELWRVNFLRPSGLKVKTINRTIPPTQKPLGHLPLLDDL